MPTSHDTYLPAKNLIRMFYIVIVICVQTGAYGYKRAISYSDYTSLLLHDLFMLSDYTGIIRIT